MQIYSDITQVKLNKPTAVTVGKFDGIHRGHELLTGKITDKKKDGFDAVVVTFDLSPRIVLNSAENYNLITADERAYILEADGVDAIAVCVFSDEMMHMEPENFVKMLYDNLNMRYMAVGTDFRFGYKGRGDVNLLYTMAKELGFQLEVVEKIKKDSRDISSTFIREEVRKGNMELVNELLGYNYFIWGEIVHGNHIGTGMGIPTINMIPPKNKLLPPNGVYVTEVMIDNRVFHGISNVGVKPTVPGEREINVETNILDFREDVYEKTAKVSFLKMVRPEMKFDSLDLLKEQILSDTKKAHEYFNL